MSSRSSSTSNVESTRRSGESLPVTAATQSSPGKRGWFRWVRLFLVSAVALLILVVVALLLGAKAKTDLIAQFPPTGQMVDVGGYRLHMDCQGSGSPTVVMEAGLTDISLAWSLVQPQVSSMTRVCIYDRAGLGWSDPSPRPRTAEVMVDELHTLLQNANIQAPYIMVGHSTGGMLVRLYAHLYSVDVVGMVLVDSQHEEQFSRRSADVQQRMQQMFAQSNEMLPLYRALATTGIGALIPAVVAMTDNPALPSPAREAYSALLLSDPKFVEAQAAETAAIFDSLAQVRAAQITSLGNIPLVVLSHGTDAPWPGMTLEDYSQWWLTLQTELSTLSPQGELIVAEQSGHYIQLDQPDLVIDAIERVLTATHS